MSRWDNSRELTRTTYDLVRATPSLKQWTVKAIVAGLLVGAIGVIPGGILAAIGAAMGGVEENGATSTTASGTALLVAGVVLMLLGWVAGATAANLRIAALVKAADEVLHGRDADVEACRAAARGRLGALTAWGAISVAVGLLVGALRGNGDGGIVSTILRSLLAGLVAAVWAVITVMVMPAIVLEGLGATAAIKRSAGLIRSTWGEALLGSVRIGARFALIYILPGILLIVGGVVLAVALGGAVVAGGVLLVIIGIGLVLWGSVLSATCRNVFGVALFRWTTGEGALGPFSEADLRGAVRTKG
jgi:hypothetical protein